MIELRQLSNDEHQVIYQYSPNGGKDKGEISLDKRNGKLNVIRRDNQGIDMFLRHAVLAVYSFFKKNDYPSKTEIAWY